MKINKSVSIFSCFLTLSLIAFVSVSHAATISGSIHESDGTTLITGDWIQVDVYQGDPCGWHDWVTCGATNTGVYTTPDLSEGTYYLRTSNRNQSNYVNEWWANPSSTNSCSGAQTVTVSTTDITGIDFQLDGGYSISGVVYQSNGITPIPDNNVRIEVITGDPCDDREWIGSAETSVGNYTIMGIPQGDYYLQTNNMNQSNYVNEWWADPLSVIPCSGAQSVTVSTANIIDKDFQLDDGYSISGMVYQSDGSTPIPDNNVYVEVYVYTEDPFGDRLFMGGAETSAGAYTIMGLPPGDYLLRARTNDQSIYASEWWAEPDSVFYFIDAQPATVVDANVTGKVFKLDVGGSITGVVVNDSGAPLANIEVHYCNDSCQLSRDAVTAASGSFVIIGLPPGLMEIAFNPDLDTLLAGNGRTYSCLALGENRNLGTIELQYGALITGVFQDAYGNPLSYVDYWYSAKFPVGCGEAENDGSFAFRLPLGTYILNIESEDYEFNAMPVEITVSDVGTPEDLGILTIYDASSGQQISGTVGYGGYAGPGKLKVIAFLNTTDLTPENLGFIQPLATAEPDQATGNYSLYVVPQSERPETTINVMLVLFLQEGKYGWGSVTVIDEIEGIETSGIPVTGKNLVYSTSGSDYTVSGVVKKSDGVVVDATILLYKQPGDEFFGFTWTDCDGAYALYNVPAGTYRIAATAYGYDTTEWSATFNVVNANVTILDILMGSNPGDELAVDFGGNGLWHYEGITWTQLNGQNSEGMEEWDGGLASDFHIAGLWNYDGSSWELLTTLNPEGITAWDDGLAVVFSSAGLWNYNGSSWDLLTTNDPQDMESWTNGLAVDFGTFGLWNYNGSLWGLLTTSDAQNTQAWVNGLAVDFGTFGLWNYNGSTWDLLTTSDAEDMEAWSGGLAVDFDTFGLWNYDGSSWNLLTTSNAELMAAWVNGLAVDFGGTGLWSYDGSSWDLLTTSDTQDMEGWATSLAVDLGTSGLWNYDGSSWASLTGWDSEDMVDVDLY